MGTALKSALAATLLVGAAAALSPAFAGNQTEDEINLYFELLFGIGEKKKSYTHPKCKTDIKVGVNPQTGEDIMSPYPCGGIAYANAGGYTVASVKLTARGPNHQPSADPYYQLVAADCKAVSKKLDADLTLGKYDVFTVPAVCAYQLSIKISAGDSKDRNLLLTPGCVITTQSDGTTTMSNWKKTKTSWAPAGEQAYQNAINNPNVTTSSSSVPKDPEDFDGHKCGEQGKAGY